MITRSLGPNADVQIDIEGPLELELGDKFLLCSDGLSGQVDDVEIATLLDCLPEELAVEVLVDLANLRGGPDNSTIVVATVEDGPLLQNKTPPPKPSPDETMVFWGTIGAIVATVLCVIASVVFFWMGSKGPMVIALVGALVAGVIAATSYSNFKQQSRRRKSSRSSGDGGLPKAYGGKAPYRRYASKPDLTLFDRLGKTVDELRDAAKLKNWMMDWDKIDQLQQQGAMAMQSGNGKSAIHLQAQAIVETMHQLREQHNRSADETAIDQ